MDALYEAAQALESAIHDEGFSFARVILPPQTLIQSEVRFEVVEFVLSDVAVRGNVNFDDENIRASLPKLAIGQSPRVDELGRNLWLANAHPSKDIEITFRESETEERSLIASIDVDDRKPWSVFTSLDNTGSGSTGPLRWTVGGQYTNLFNRDHSMLVTYSTSPGHANQVKQAAASYRAPLYAFGGELTAYAVHSDVDVGRVLNAFDVSGRGRYYGLRYSHVLLRRGAWNSRTWVGIEDRIFDNSVKVGTLDLAQDVRSRPLSFGYGGEYSGEGWIGDARIEYVRNIPSGGGNNTLAYVANRAGADVTWDLVRANMSGATSVFGDWLVRAAADVQRANEALIAGEQFGLGGVNSVRGFQEREISGDDGARVSLELWTPPIEGTGGLRLLGFFDAGRVWLKSQEQPNGTAALRLASVGIGARWQWREHASVSLDFGHVVDGRQRDDSMRGHLNVLVSY